MLDSLRHLLRTKAMPNQHQAHRKSSSESEEASATEEEQQQEHINDTKLHQSIHIH